MGRLIQVQHYYVIIRLDLKMVEAVILFPKTSKLSIYPLCGSTG